MKQSSNPTFTILLLAFCSKNTGNCSHIWVRSGPPLHNICEVRSFHRSFSAGSISHHTAVLRVDAWQFGDEHSRQWYWKRHFAVLVCRHCSYYMAQVYYRRSRKSQATDGLRAHTHTHTEGLLTAWQRSCLLFTLPCRAFGEMGELGKDIPLSELQSFRSK